MIHNKTKANLIRAELSRQFFGFCQIYAFHDTTYMCVKIVVHALMHSTVFSVAHHKVRPNAAMVYFAF